MFDNDKVCRTCLSDNLLSYPILEFSNGDSSVKDMLMECASVYVSVEDNLPKVICQKCFELLQLAYNFKLQCKKSEEILLLSCTDNKSKLKTEETDISDDDRTETKYFTPEVQIQCSDDDKIEIDCVDNKIGDENTSNTGNKQEIVENKNCKPKQHMKTTTDNRNKTKQSREKRFFCLKCNKGYRKKHTLTRHYKAKHPIDAETLIDTLVMRRNQQGEFSCTECQKCFKKKDYLNRHFRKAHSEQTYKCDVCSEGFMYYTKYFKHKLQHGFPCSVCLDVFNDEITLQKHVSTHDPQIKFICKFTDCGQKFQNKRRLFVHYKAYHGDVNKYLCTTCGKLCFSSSNLISHMTIHDERKKYFCKMCDKSYRLKDSLIHHNNTVHAHKPTGYACNICGKVFKNRKYLPGHSLTHVKNRIKKHKCEYCEKRFDRKSDCRTHTRIHTGEKPYQCSICTKRFAQQCALKTHFKIHDTLRT